MLKEEVYHLIKKKKVYNLISKEKKKKKNWELQKLQKRVNFGNLIYCFKGSTKDIDFSYFIDAETPFNDIKLKRKRSEEVGKNQIG